MSYPPREEEKFLHLDNFNAHQCRRKHSMNVSNASTWIATLDKISPERGKRKVHPLLLNSHHGEKFWGKSQKIGEMILLTFLS